MTIRSAVRFLPGSTKPFLGYNDLEQKVVVKAMVRPTMGKLLLNEYIVGNLAVSIGLPWAQTSLASLSSDAVHFLEDNSLDVCSIDCVAMEFVDHLLPVGWPKPPQGFDHWDVLRNSDHRNSFREANRIHLGSYFNKPEEQSAFYGRALFENWLFFQDTKYDTLFALPNKCPFFVDGSHAFAGMDWDPKQMKYHKFYSFKSPYLEGILTQPHLFNGWLKLIQSISQDEISSLLTDVPATWGMGATQLDFLRNLLTDQREDFVQSWNGETNQSLLRYHS